jgi:hypothetical protein
MGHHTLRATDLGLPDHLREELDLSRTVQMRWDICAHWKGASLRMYGVRYTYLSFDLFLSYSIQVEVIDIFLPASKIFDPHRPQLPGFPLGVRVQAYRGVLQSTMHDGCEIVAHPHTRGRRFS